MCNLFVPEWRGISLVLFYFNFKHIITVIAKIKVILISIKTYGQIVLGGVSIGMSSMQF